MTSLWHRGRVRDDEPDVKDGQRIPGEVGIWIFVLLDLSVFAVFFLVIAVYRVSDPSDFFRGHESLDKRLAVINTIVLVTGSLSVVRAIQTMRSDPSRNTRAARFLYLAVVCGVVFACVKVVEYVHIFGSGVTIDTSSFFLCYIGFTMIHLVHVLIGMTVLGVVGRRVGQGRASIPTVESAGLYWHMVDLLWLILFPLLYLI